MTADENKIREQRIQVFVDELEEILREVHAFNYGYMFHKAIDLEIEKMRRLPMSDFKEIVKRVKKNHPEYDFEEGKNDDRNGKDDGVSCDAGDQRDS